MQERERSREGGRERGVIESERRERRTGDKNGEKREQAKIRGMWRETIQRHREDMERRKRRVKKRNPQEED